MISHLDLGGQNEDTYTCIIPKELRGSIGVLIDEVAIRQGQPQFLNMVNMVNMVHGSSGRPNVVEGIDTVPRRSF
jgi:hypothetical protein